MCHLCPLRGHSGGGKVGEEGDCGRRPWAGGGRRGGGLGRGRGGKVGDELVEGRGAEEESEELLVLCVAFLERGGVREGKWRR